MEHPRPDRRIHLPVVAWVLGGAAAGIVAGTAFMASIGMNHGAHANSELEVRVSVKRFGPPAAAPRLDHGVLALVAGTN